MNLAVGMNPESAFGLCQLHNGGKLDETDGGIIIRPAPANTKNLANGLHSSSADASVVGV